MIIGCAFHCSPTVRNSPVSERQGHANVTVTLTVYGYVLPGDQKRAAARFAELIGEA